MTSKQATIIAAVALALAVGLLIYAGIGEYRRTERIERTEAAMTQVCHTVKGALRIDREILKDERSRDRMLWNFGTDRIGDGYVMLEWCIPYRFPIEAFRVCADHGNYACIESMLVTAETSIP